MLPPDGQFKASEQVRPQEQTKLRKRNVQELLPELLLREQAQAATGHQKAEEPNSRHCQGRASQGLQEERWEGFRYKEPGEESAVIEHE